MFFFSLARDLEGFNCNRTVLQTLAEIERESEQRIEKNQEGKKVANLCDKYWTNWCRIISHNRRPIKSSPYLKLPNEMRGETKKKKTSTERC